MAKSTRSSKNASVASDSSEFKNLVISRWSVSLLLTLLMVGSYFAFIICLALRPDLLALRLSENLPVGIVAGVGLICLAWILTGIYVIWANLSYDKQIKRLSGKRSQ